MQESSLVSVIVRTYNRAHLIAETVQSVIDQTYKTWELIVVDDGSTDNTKRLISDFNDGRIKYYSIEQSGVIGKVRNAGINYSKGEYIAFLDSDDLWLPKKLEFQLSLLNKYSQASFVFGHGEQFGNNATPTPIVESFFVGNVFLPFLLEERFIFYVPTLLFKKEILGKTKLIDEELSRAGDIDFFLRMAHSFDGVFSNQLFVQIRKQEQSHSRENELSAYDEYFIMLEKLLQGNLMTPKQFTQVASWYHYKLGLFYLRDGKSRRATKEFIQYINLNPFGWKGWIRLVQSASTVAFGRITL